MWWRQVSCSLPLGSLNSCVYIGHEKLDPQASHNNLGCTPFNLDEPGMGFLGPIVCKKFARTSMSQQWLLITTWPHKCIFFPFTQGSAIHSICLHRQLISLFYRPGMNKTTTPPAVQDKLFFTCIIDLVEKGVVTGLGSIGKCACLCE